MNTRDILSVLLPPAICTFENNSNTLHIKSSCLQLSWNNRFTGTINYLYNTCIYSVDRALGRFSFLLYILNLSTKQALIYLHTPLASEVFVDEIEIEVDCIDSNQ